MPFFLFKEPLKNIRQEECLVNYDDNLCEILHTLKHLIPERMQQKFIE